MARLMHKQGLAKPEGGLAHGFVSTAAGAQPFPDSTKAILEE
jgi:hypothetical protein